MRRWWRSSAWRWSSRRSAPDCCWRPRWRAQSRRSPRPKRGRRSRNADRLGATPIADEAAALLRRLGVAVSRGVPGDGSALVAPRGTGPGAARRGAVEPRDRRSAPPEPKDRRAPRRTRVVEARCPQPVRGGGRGHPSKRRASSRPDSGLATDRRAAPEMGEVTDARTCRAARHSSSSPPPGGTRPGGTTIMTSTNIAPRRHRARGRSRASRSSRRSCCRTTRAGC